MSGRTGARRHGRNAGELRKQRSRPSEILARVGPGPALSMPLARLS